LEPAHQGGEIHAQWRHGRCAVLHQARDVVLTVTDTGQGIDPAFLLHLFDMLRLAEPISTRTHGGLGIGLSIVRRPSRTVLTVRIPST
jgi:signal transduction histidine kinase